MKNGVSFIFQLFPAFAKPIPQLRCYRILKSTGCNQDLSENGKIFRLMNLTALSSSLQSYIDSECPSEGLKIHAHILKIGLQLNTNLSIKLLILYLKSGYLNFARQVFDQMKNRTISSWNYMILGCLRQGETEEALTLIYNLGASGKKLDGFTYAIILRLSAKLRAMKLGKEVHTQILKSRLESDDVLFTALVDSYVKNGEIDFARKVFDKIPDRNTFCSTAMISGYMKQGLIENAEEIFENLVEKDVVVWNAMIEGYSCKIETAGQSLVAYNQMLRLNFQPTLSTFSSIIGACSVLAALEQGQQIHAQLLKTCYFSDVKSGSALVDMYSKCGRIDCAQQMFDEMPERNVVSWTTMIDGYGKNGNPVKALQLFNQMKNDCSIKPNYVTFLSALSACGHAGKLSEGQEIFESMKRDYCLEPKVEHCACMVDLLGRAGNLHEALKFIREMPIKPNSDVWAALLGASRLYGDVEMAAIAAKQVFELSKSGRPGAYVALSNTLAAAGEWEGVCRVRDLMKGRGVSKDAGCSRVETENGICGLER